MSKEELRSEEIMTKRCCKCGSIKDLGGFYKNKHRKDGHCEDCKDCRKKSDYIKRQKNSKYKNKPNDLENEAWKDIKGYEGLYQVSNMGRIKSLERATIARNNPRTIRGKIRKLANGTFGYKIVNLCENSICKMFQVHRLVAQAFISNPNDYPCVNHKDENKTNNKTENLEWCTYEYNNNYGTHNERKADSCRKKVYQYDSSRRFIKEWKSTVECGENGYNQSNVSECCIGKRKTHKGYIWSYSILNEHCNE